MFEVSPSGSNTAKSIATGAWWKSDAAGGKFVQGQVLFYPGEINDSQHESRCRTIEVFDEKRERTLHRQKSIDIAILLRLAQPGHLAIVEQAILTADGQVRIADVALLTKPSRTTLAR